MKPEIQRFYLAVPLIYLKEPKEQLPGEPFDLPEPAASPEGERLYCFEINPSQALEFEPDEGVFLKSLLFCGRTAGKTVLEGSPDTPPCSSGDEKVELPPGNYLFSQEEGRLPYGEIMEMAIEIQKEGLWQRLKPGSCFYLRYLYEDGRDVTQVFRPYDQKTHGL